MGTIGACLADLDGDGVSELFVTEMLLDSLNRRKTKTVFESWDKYQLNVQDGYYHQFPGMYSREDPAMATMLRWDEWPA